MINIRKCKKSLMVRNTYLNETYKALRVSNNIDNSWRQRECMSKNAIEWNRQKGRVESQKIEDINKIMCFVRLSGILSTTVILFGLPWERYIRVVTGKPKRKTDDRSNPGRPCSKKKEEVQRKDKEHEGNRRKDGTVRELKGCDSVPKGHQSLSSCGQIIAGILLKCSRDKSLVIRDNVVLSGVWQTGTTLSDEIKRNIVNPVRRESDQHEGKKILGY